MNPSLSGNPERVHEAVAEFAEAFDASTDVNLWMELVNEESQECLDAIRNDDKLNGLKEAADLMYVVAGLARVLPDDMDERLEAELKFVILDAFYTAVHIKGYFNFCGTQIMEAFYRVHASNMSKLGEDGKPIRREDGKILKGPNYREPDLTDLV